MTTLEVVLDRFRDAELPPSGIDRLLGLPKGRSHDLIVQWWKSKKDRSEAAEKEAARGRDQ